MESAQADPARFVEPYDRYFHRVWACVIRRAAHRAKAEDVTSEVLCRALENLKAYEWRGAPFVAWLFRIASNSLADRRRKDQRETGDPPPEAAGPDADPERRGLPFQLVDRLPGLQRRVIELRFIGTKACSKSPGSRVRRRAPSSSFKGGRWKICARSWRRAVADRLSAWIKAALAERPAAEFRSRL